MAYSIKNMAYSIKNMAYDKMKWNIQSLSMKST